MLNKGEWSAVYWILGLAFIFALMLAGIWLLESEEESSNKAMNALDHGNNVIESEEPGFVFESRTERKERLKRVVPVILDFPFVNIMSTKARPWIGALFDPMKEDEFRRDISNRSAGQQEVELFYGVPVVVPADQKERKSSNLDIPVSLKLENSTAWEALKSILRQINCNRRFGDETDFGADFRGTYPVAFFEERCITLTVESVSAREAVAAVAACSPVQFSLFCENAVYRELSYFHCGIWFYKNGHLLDWHRDAEGVNLEDVDLSWWAKEKHEATLPTDECLPIPEEAAAEQ